MSVARLRLAAHPLRGLARGPEEPGSAVPGGAWDCARLRRAYGTTAIASISISISE